MSAAGREDRSRLDGFGLEIFELVRAHADSEQWRDWLRAPLEHAAAKGDMDLFARLMDAGADGSAGCRGYGGRTLLGAAVSGETEDIVPAMLEAWAKDDVNVQFGEEQATALHVAAGYGVEKACRALLLAGANPNVVDGFEEGPLHQAAKAGHDGVVEILVVNGADPNARMEHRGQTPLHLAAERDHARCVSKLLAGGADMDSCDLRGQTPLQLAARRNRLRAVEQLLAAGANTEIRPDDGFYSALGTAAFRGHVDVVRALMRHGSSVSTCDDEGYTALHHAAAIIWPDDDKTDVIRVLLEAGADVEAKTIAFGLTPLHIAAQDGSSGNLRALVEGGANINSRRASGDTALHDASRRSNVGGVELLLRLGADETIVDGGGDTAGDQVGKKWKDEEKRQANNKLIRHMLACAPADRAWRRRGWMVLVRVRPGKVRLAHDSDTSGRDRTGDEMSALVRLVGRVVCLEIEGIFRVLVGFL